MPRLSDGATRQEAPRTRYGINANDREAVRERIAECGAVGVARVFYSEMLPATWDRSREGASPYSECHVSFKAEPAAVAAGTHDRRITAWLASVPGDWTVYLTFWHEPNDELRDGRFSATIYRDAWSRLSGLVRDTGQGRRTVEIRLVPIFMADRVDTPGYWSDEWVPSPHEVDFLSWDIYGNPSGGTGLSGQYPAPQTRIDPVLRVTQRLGFDDWGISEFNSPTRTWDSDESARRAWLTAFRAHAADNDRSVGRGLGAPHTMLLWEGKGANWDQTFKSAETWTWWREVLSSADQHA